MTSTISLKHALEITGCSQKDTPVIITTGATIRDKKDCFLSQSDILNTAAWMGNARVTKIMTASKKDQTENKASLCFVVDPDSVRPTGDFAYYFTQYGEERTNDNLLDIIKFSIEEVLKNTQRIE